MCVFSQGGVFLHLHSQKYFLFVFPEFSHVHSQFCFVFFFPRQAAGAGGRLLRKGVGADGGTRQRPPPKLSVNFGGFPFSYLPPGATAVDFQQIFAPHAGNPFFPQFDPPPLREEQHALEGSLRTTPEISPPVTQPPVLLPRADRLDVHFLSPDSVLYRQRVDQAQVALAKFQRTAQSFLPGRREHGLPLAMAMVQDTKPCWSGTTLKRNSNPHRFLLDYFQNGLLL
jgi:hypothetical protein